MSELHRDFLTSLVILETVVNKEFFSDDHKKPQASTGWHNTFNVLQVEGIPRRSMMANKIPPKATVAASCMKPFPIRKHQPSKNIWISRHYIDSFNYLWESIYAEGIFRLMGPHLSSLENRWTETGRRRRNNETTTPKTKRQELRQHRRLPSPKHDLGVGKFSSFNRSLSRSPSPLTN